MDINLLKKLIKVVEQSDITEFSVQEGDLKVKISKNTNAAAPAYYPQGPASMEVQVPANAPAPKAEDNKPAEKETAEEAPKGNLYEVKSPIVGTFYRAPSPDAEPFVRVGDKIQAGSVLCIVEAMKLMNEIESEVSGKIVKILADNQTPVEYNQPLFLIEKE